MPFFIFWLNCASVLIYSSTILLEVLSVCRHAPEKGGLFYLRTANHKEQCKRVPVADYKYCPRSTKESNSFRHSSNTTTPHFSLASELLNFKMNTGKTLKEALQNAQADGRVTVGVYECAKIMTE